MDGGQVPKSLIDSIIPTAVLSAASLVNNLLSSAKATKELAKQSGDSELKEQIADLFDTVLDVKERVLELGQENRLLKEQLAEKTLIERDTTTTSFYKRGEIEPLCPKCYQGPKHALVYLERQRDGTGWCPFCGNERYANRKLPPSEE